MKKKQPPMELETFTIGPTVCGNFSAGKDFCHHCVAKGCYGHYLCFTKPTVGNKGIGYAQQKEQLREIADIIGGGKT